MGEIQRSIKLPAGWKTSALGLSAIKSVTDSLISTGSHGIISNIPIVCRGKDCPYYETCPMAEFNVDVNTLIGERCPVEISQILKLFQEYVEHFGIDIENTDKVILGLLKELINYEIQIDRADKRIAAQGDFLEDVVIGVDANGRAIKNKMISKPIDYRDRANTKKQQILTLLNSTPKDKAGQKVNVTFDPSTYASNLIAKAKALQESGDLIVDADYRQVD